MPDNRFIPVITFDELMAGIEFELQDSKFGICAKLLLSAINDWPVLNLSEPGDLIAELQKEINKSLTFENLNVYLSGLQISVAGNSWKMEALTSLLQIFAYNIENPFHDEVTLESIIEEITQYYRAQSNLG